MKKYIINFLSLFYSDELHLHYQVRPNGSEELLYADKEKYVGNQNGRYSLTEREAFIKGKL